MRYLYRCRKCGGNFDAGELHGGVCDECITQSGEREKRNREMAALLLCDTDGQMVLEVQ